MCLCIEEVAAAGSCSNMPSSGWGDSNGSTQEQSNTCKPAPEEGAADRLNTAMHRLGSSQEVGRRISCASPSRMTHRTASPQDLLKSGTPDSCHR
mmetsp:Transcript_50875/g.90886  ORF Transcript_50875/g.90886 Transcript_50875/m.90886 type:complete len:95 (-) Transcript_50875:155-439(-)